MKNPAYKLELAASAMFIALLLFLLMLLMMS